MVAVSTPVASVLLRLWIPLMVFFPLLSGTAQAADYTDKGIVVTASTTRVELGKPIYLELTTGYDSPSLAQTDLSPLEDDFVINQIGDIEYVQQSREQKLRIRIYPRATGTFRIPALSMARDISSPLFVDVTPALDPKDGSPIVVKFEYTEGPLWLKEQYMVRALLSARADVMVLEVPGPELGGFQALVLNTRRTGKAGHNREANVFETGWALFATRAGDYSLDLPPLKYIRDGVNTHLFYPPRLHIKVRPLPVYLPGTTPLGKYSISIDAPVAPLLVKNRLNQFHIEILSEGTMAHDIPALHTLFRGGQVVSSYAANREQARLTNTDGVQYLTRYTLPFTVNEAGLFSLPEIKLQYLDPASGKIMVAQTMAQHYLVINPWLYYLTVVILLLCILVLLTLVLKRILRVLELMMTYYRVLDSIQKAGQAQEIKSALMCVADVEGWPVNLTLLQWRQQWNQCFPRLPQGGLAIQLLCRQLYSGQQTQLEPVKQDLLRMLVSRMFVLRLLGGTARRFSQA